MRLYLAGPMRGIPEFNFPAFREARIALRALGHVVFCPAEHDQGNGFDVTGTSGTDGDLDDQGFDLRDALATDLDWIATSADGVAVLPGWESSRGARAEVATALALDLAVAPVNTFLEEWDEGALAGETERIAASMIGTPSGFSVSPGGEVRTVSATGGEKGRKLAELGTVDPVALLKLAEVSGFGAQKYEAFNYLRGYDWSLSFNAAQRHLLAFWAGEDNDVESGLPHLGHAAWHCLAMLSFLVRDLGTDDRFKQA